MTGSQGTQQLIAPLRRAIKGNAQPLRPGKNCFAVRAKGPGQGGIILPVAASAHILIEAFHRVLRQEGHVKTMHPGGRAPPLGQHQHPLIRPLGVEGVGRRQGGKPAPNN